MVYRIHFTFLKKTGMDIKFPFKHIYLFIYNKHFDILCMNGVWKGNSGWLFCVWQGSISVVLLCI